jgi:hypothetical protein
VISLVGRDPGAYVAHPLHGPGRTYPETNCYADILVELLHARGHEPLAVLGFLARMDFEGDQWTFFKPPPGDLEHLFGVDVHEMQPYRALPDQIAEQLAAGRTMIVELDAWFLPDTAATSYRTEHVKTSAAMAAIDPAAERLRYFHNAGLHELAGEDYRGALRLDGVADGSLPPYAELVRFDAGPALAGAALRAAARALSRAHLAKRPASNPFERFGGHLAATLPALLDGDAAGYHDYAFATVRMAGSGFELYAAHVDWLLGADGADASAALTRIVDGCKLLSFKLARRRAFDPADAVAGLASAWSEATERLDAALG